jgi:protein translocase SecG subunit
MNQILVIIQILLSLLLIILVFFQTNNANDGRSNFLSDSVAEKRGWEKVTFNLTLLVLTLFIISSVIQVLI